MFSKGFKSKIFVQGNVDKSEINDLLAETKNAITKGGSNHKLLPFSDKVPEQRM